MNTYTAIGKTWRIGNGCFQCPQSGATYHIHVQVEYDFNQRVQMITSFVNGAIVYSGEWRIYRSGVMYRDELPMFWGESLGRDQAIQYIKRQGASE